MWLNVGNPQNENLGLALGKAVTKEREGECPGDPEGTIVMQNRMLCEWH